jgi:hypothetical protein
MTTTTFASTPLSIRDLSRRALAALPLRALALLSLGMLATLAVTERSAQAGSWIASAVAAESAPQDDYDRLDGMGASGEKVNVIEWEGNLEIHVYPGGSLKGLALKLDKRNKDKPVMVIGYRFNTDPSKQLIRRAILGIDLREGFKVYRDPSPGSEYDKIVISNNGQSGDLVAFHTDPEPTQLYPDGHPALAQAPGPAAKAAAPERREPASNPATTLDDAGTIQPFFMRPTGIDNRR